MIICFHHILKKTATLKIGQDESELNKRVQFSAMEKSEKVDQFPQMRKIILHYLFSPTIYIIIFFENKHLQRWRSYCFIVNTLLPFQKMQPENVFARFN